MSARRAYSRPAPSRTAPRQGDPRIYSVSEIVFELHDLLEFEYPSIVVQGEVSSFKPHPSGHDYFCIKDVKAELQVAFFANRERVPGFRLENGIVVQVEGKITVYEKRGSMQLLADRVAPVGYGALQAKFEALKKKLQLEGLFAEERKRELPKYPTRVALVTALSGAAIQDMTRVIREHAPYVQIIVAPARVQGAGAALDIAASIRLVNDWGNADVLIVGRGGGSLEDLWAFNEEPVVRAIAGSRIPVISAVGHEADYTLSDLAADVRAATPTHAARRVTEHLATARRELRDLTTHARERLLRELREHQRHLTGYRTHRAFRVPHQQADGCRQALGDAHADLIRSLEGWVARRRSTLAIADEKLHGHAPARLFERMRERMKGLGDRASRAAADLVSRRRTDIRGVDRLLASYDYRGVLKRGYALVWTERGERLVNRGAHLREGEPIQVQFRDARADAQVTRVTPALEEEGT
ncbi:MAG TPA: exodeoxyribonuclease VII large subunit [Candidatus Eisenbacteria bacterium]|nr:exodeoxyribonuclease VII large subunit [Candidatus Eisenbacteria bacterium]